MVLCGLSVQKAAYSFSRGIHCVYLFLNSFSKTAPFRVIVLHLCFLLLSISIGDTKKEALPQKGKGMCS